MADNFLQFSESLDALTPEETAWLKHQLGSIVAISGTEYGENDPLPDGNNESIYEGLRFLRDYEDQDGDDDPTEKGFSAEFRDEEVSFTAEANGDPGHLAHLIHAFLKRFRPDQCWSLTYAETCSKLRDGEFCGGAVFVTADGIAWQSSHGFVAQQRAAFEAAKSVRGVFDQISGENVGKDADSA